VDPSTQQHNLWDALSANWLQPAALGVGLRVSEVLALKWSDFDFENLTLEVVREWPYAMTIGVLL
jgi:integrase